MNNFEHYHLPFFDENECLEIVKYIQNKDIYLKENCKDIFDKSPKYSEDQFIGSSTFENYTTNLYYAYNFFKDNPKYLPRLRKLLAKKFPNLTYPLIVQSWGNIYHKNQGIDWHTHHLIDHRILNYRTLNGITSNIFVGGHEDIGITYAFPVFNKPRYKYVNIKNRLGYIQFVNNSVYHMVRPNPSDEKRYSIGVTITEFDVRFAQQINRCIFVDDMRESTIIIPEPYFEETKKTFKYS